MREDIVVGIDSRPAARGGDEVVRKLSDIKKSADSAGSSLDKLGRGGSGGIAALGRSAGDTTRQLAYLKNDLAATGRGVDQLGSNMSRMSGTTANVIALWRTFGAVLAGIGLFALGRAFIAATDSMKKMEAQLKLTLFGTATLSGAWANVRNIAQATRAPLEATVELYSRIARQAQGLGVTTEQVARATETYAKTLKISGATSEEAAGAIRQFSQAMARGQLKGDEFISMLENNSRMTRLLADSLGVADGALLKMAKDGELTGKILMKALTEGRFTGTIDEEFKQIPITFGDAMTLIKNSATVTFAAFDKGGMFSTALTNFMTGGADNLTELEGKFQELGIKVRAIFDGFASLFDPMHTSGASFFSMLEAQVEGLQNLIRDVLSSIDKFQNWRADVHNRAVGAARMPWENDYPTVPIGEAPPEGSIRAYWGRSDLATQFETNRSISESDNRQRTEVDRMNSNLPSNSAYHFEWKHGAIAVVQGKPYAGSMGDRGLNPEPEADKPKGPAMMTLGDPMGGAGSMTSARGWRTDPITGKSSYHKGTDYGAARGTPLYAPADGVIGAAADVGDGYGKKVVIEFGGNSKAQLAHLDSILVKSGDIVKKGQRIGTVGSTGRSTGNHLDYRVWSGGEEIAGTRNAKVKVGKGLGDAIGDQEAEAQKLAEEMTKAQNAAAQYQAELRQGTTHLAVINALQEKINAGDDRARSAMAEQNRMQVENEAKLANRQKFGEAWNRLLPQEQAAQDAIATSLARQRMDAEAKGRLLAAEATDIESAKRQQAEIATLAAGNWKLAEKISEEERVRIAIEERKALLLAANQPLYTDMAKASIASASAAEREKIAREKIAAALQVWNSAAAGTVTGGQLAAADDYDRKQKQIADAYAKLHSEALARGDVARAEQLTKINEEIAFNHRQEFFAANLAIAKHFADKIRNAMNQIGDGLEEIFGGKTGKTLGAAIRSIGDMAASFKKAQLFGQSGAPWSAYRADENSGPVANVLSGANDILHTIFGKEMQPGGSLEGLGKVLGQATQGAEMGQATAGLGKSIFGKKNYSTTGAQVGGAVGAVGGAIVGGMIGGPLGAMVGQLIGSMIGSVIGGLIGGLFKDKKVKEATATVENAYDKPSVTGKKMGGEKDTAAMKLAEGVQSAMVQIAAALGSSLGAFRITIGMYGDQFTAMGQKFATEKEAVLHAIKAAISQGALKDISPESKRVLTTARDPLAVIDAVAAYEKLELQILKLKDPIAGAFKEFVDGFRIMHSQMLAAGYTVEELGKLEEAYALQRAELLKQATADLRNFIQQISAGPDSGLSVQGQYENAMIDFAKMEADLAAGKPIDQAEFLKVSQLALQLGGQLYGTSTAEYAALRDRIITASNLAIEAIEQLAPDETLAAEIAKAGGETVTAIGTTNNLLTEIRDILAGGSTGGTTPVTNSDGAQPDTAFV